MNWSSDINPMRVMSDKSTTQLKKKNSHKLTCIQQDSPSLGDNHRMQHQVLMPSKWIGPHLRRVLQIKGYKDGSN